MGISFLNGNKDGKKSDIIRLDIIHIIISGVNDGWAEKAIAHSGFGRIIMWQRQRQCTTLLLAHPAIGSYLRP